MGPGALWQHPLSGKDGKCVSLRSPPDIMCAVGDIRWCKTAPLIFWVASSLFQKTDGNEQTPWAWNQTVDVDPKLRFLMTKLDGQCFISEGGWPRWFQEFLETYGIEIALSLMTIGHTFFLVQNVYIFPGVVWQCFEQKKSPVTRPATKTFFMYRSSNE